MLTEHVTTEDIIIEIIKSHTDFSNTINQHEIAEHYMFMTDEHMAGRRVRKIIEKLIKDGYPIISTPINPGGGYCWNGGPGEALQCYKRLRRKGIKILLRARRILRNHMIGKQRTLFDITDQ